MVETRGIEHAARLPHSTPSSFYAALSLFLPLVTDCGPARRRRINLKCSKTRIQSNDGLLSQDCEVQHTSVNTEHFNKVFLYRGTPRCVA